MYLMMGGEKIIKSNRKKIIMIIQQANYKKNINVKNIKDIKIRKRCW